MINWQAAEAETETDDGDSAWLDSLASPASMAWMSIYLNMLGTGLSQDQLVVLEQPLRPALYDEFNDPLLNLRVNRAVELWQPWFENFTRLALSTLDDHRPEELMSDATTSLPCEARIRATADSHELTLHRQNAHLSPKTHAALTTDRRDLPHKPVSVSFADRLRSFFHIKPVQKSWADAIGLVFTERGLAAELSWSVPTVQAARMAGWLFGVPTFDHTFVYPAAQIRTDGSVVGGLRWVLDQLPESIVDRYTLAAWLSGVKTESGKTIWEALHESSHANSEVQARVRRYRATLVAASS